ncbi:nitroreductase family protein [Gorillibacterium sp. sgz500922]|uniref:nitroreductase family protein n=1 Tax=Gorillibacterium sp. sgz500922 TaxID=3446694 RepID=UPI003F670953
MTVSALTNDFSQILSGRRSIRQYDPSVKIGREEMSEILRQATLAPSSVNLQPWHFLVIESPEAKAKLAPLARFNQKQVETSSAVIAVFGDMKSVENLEVIYGKAVELGLMPQDVKDRQVTGISAYYAGMSERVNRDTILIDCGLVSMQLMLAARAHGYDTNPIGGFERDVFAETFGLDPERYVPVMLLSIGKAAESGYPSYRLPVETVAEWK